MGCIASGPMYGASTAVEANRGVQSYGCQSCYLPPTPMSAYTPAQVLYDKLLSSDGRNGTYEYVPMYEIILSFMRIDSLTFIKSRAVVAA